MIALLTVILGGAVLSLGDDASWWLSALFVLPALLWAPGDGLARWLSRTKQTTGLQVFIDGAWIGLALAWMGVSLARELEWTGSTAVHHWWWMALIITAIGQGIAYRDRSTHHTPRRELIGLGTVVAALIILMTWRAQDISRTLDGYWYLEGADSIEQPSLNIRPGSGWASSTILGDPEFGALKLVPAKEDVTLVAPMGANGVVVLAARGPVGSDIEVEGRRNEVRFAMTENEEEGPVRRYLEDGVAGIRVPVHLEPDEEIELKVHADEVYLFPGTEAIWQVHARGTLRWVHYYQILNQVENQVWAREILDSRRVTLNQPPGWSPILAISTLVVTDDLPAATALFLWVLLLVGATSVRLASILAPGAPWSAWAIPAGMTLSHGLLMLEPMSANFPDSLFAASVLGIVTALAGGRPGWFAFMGVWAQALRWPGGILATILALSWWLVHRTPIRQGLAWLWCGIGAGLAVTLGLVWQAKECIEGQIESGCTWADAPELADLSFILYFETFPEHWHDDYRTEALLPRIPEFYGHWIMYTGAGLLIACLCLFGSTSRARSGLRSLLLGAGVYSMILCTIDHHPTHYFLPLVALTGPAVVAASATGGLNRTRHLISTACLMGLLIFLWTGQV